jgi:hypothetical protein
MFQILAALYYDTDKENNYIPYNNWYLYVFYYVSKCRYGQSSHYEGLLA